MSQPTALQHRLQVARERLANESAEGVEECGENRVSLLEPVAEQSSRLVGHGSVSGSPPVFFPSQQNTSPMGLSEILAALDAAVVCCIGSDFLPGCERFDCLLSGGLKRSLSRGRAVIGTTVPASRFVSGLDFSLKRTLTFFLLAEVLCMHESGWTHPCRV